MSRGAHLLLDDESDYSESISSSGRTFDSLDDLLSRFTLDFRPEYLLKIRNRLGPLIVGVDASHLPEHRETAGAAVIKPVNQASWWRRFRITTNGTVTLRSRKLQWWVFTLDLEGVANPIHRTSSCSFRVATKWDLSRGEYRNKRKSQLGDATEGRVHWHVNYNLPQVEGTFGADARDVSQEMHAEVGYAHAEVSKLELVVWPWRNNPKRALSSTSNSSNGEEEAATDAATAVVDEAVMTNRQYTRRKNDAVAKALSDLQHHVVGLQEWWDQQGEAATRAMEHLKKAAAV